MKYNDILDNSFESSEYNCQDYYLAKNNKIYKITIESTEDTIIINSNKYLVSFNLIVFSKLFNIKFDTINKSYEYIINIFEENNVEIKDIIINKEMKLLLILNNNKIEISLKYNKNKKDYIINELNKLKKEIQDLKKENNILKQKVNKLKEYRQDPKNIKLLTDIVSDSYNACTLDNTFSIFKSVNNILCLIYYNNKHSIVSYDLNNQKTMSIINKSHNKQISNLRHYFDKKNKRDLIISLSFRNNNLKLWDFKDWKCLLNIPQANQKGFLFSACLLSENDKDYIVTSNYNEKENSENIKIFDLNGKKIKEINNSNKKTILIDTYYDNLTSKIYIIFCTNDNVQSYDYYKNEIYKIYDDNNNQTHFSFKIFKSENIIKLIDSCKDGNIRIWDFHTGFLLNKIKLSNKSLIGICLWNDNFIFVACQDKTIKLVELKRGIVVRCLYSHSNEVLSVKIVNHPLYGKCLLSQGNQKDQIKLWNI